MSKIIPTEIIEPIKIIEPVITKLSTSSISIAKTIPQKIETTIYNIEELLNQKQNLEWQIGNLQGELDEVNQLIAECETLGISK